MRIQFVVFILVAFLLNAAGHFYLYRRLIRDPEWGKGTRRWGRLLFVVLSGSMFLAMPLSFFLPDPIAGPISMFGYLWMGIGFYLLVTCGLSDVLRTTVRLIDRIKNFHRRENTPPEDPSRRIMLARATAQLAGLSTVGLSAAGFRGGLGEVEVKEVGVQLERFPRALSGFTLVQLTDLHIGHVIRPEYLRSVVDRVRDLRPDAVVITGDMVDGTVEELRPLLTPLADLSSRYGTFFVTGNHEYYAGAVEWEREITRMGMRVLRNERVEIGDGAARFDLAGIDDYSAARFGFGHGSDLAKACRGRNPDRELILLAHQPRSIEQSERYDVGLQISGHTHGGQIWPVTDLYSLFFRYVSGLHRHNDRTQIYVSCGTGYWGPPMRLGAPAEITKIILAPT